VKKLLSDSELLARLVGFDTTSRNSNLPLAEFICDYLDRPGVRVVRQPSPEGDKANVIVTVGPERSDGDGRGGLVLSGHMDVVPAEEDGWESDPFTLTERDQTYVGRGSCDMKSFLALAINAAASVTPERLAEPLVLILTYDEEVGLLGAKHFAETWPEPASLPRNTIIGEPTSLNVIRMHKGYLHARIGLTGKAAHSGYPHLGENAIEPAGRVIVALSELRDQMERERPPHNEYFPEVPYVALNVAQVSGGVAVNVVPDHCDLEVGARLLPEMETAHLVQRMQDAVTKALGETPYAFEVVNASPPMLLNEEASIYRMLCAEVGQQETLSASYATDAGWLQTIGLDCVIFGPGSIDVAHKPNESMPISDFVRAAELLDKTIGHCCLATAGREQR
jgi:acetylornithine deacetylase